MSNSPSQRSARPLITRAGAAFLFLPSPQTGSGAPRRRQPVALARRDQPRLRGVARVLRLKHQTRTPLGAPPWRFLAGVRASVSGISSGIRTASSSQPGHCAWRAGSRASRVRRVRTGSRGTPLPAPLQARLEKRPSTSRDDSEYRVPRTYSQGVHRSWRTARMEPPGRRETPPDGRLTRSLRSRPLPASGGRGDTERAAPTVIHPPIA